MIVGIELFGAARLRLGTARVDVEVPPGSSLRDALLTLAESRPGLIGHVLLPDPLRPTAGYSVCLDGREFVEDLDSPVRPGQTLQLLPSAGGGAANCA